MTDQMIHLTFTYLRKKLKTSELLNPFTALPRVTLGVNTASYTPVTRVWLGLNMG